MKIKVLVCSMMVLGLSAQSFADRRTDSDYAFDVLIGNADQNNDTRGANSITGNDTSMGIRFTASLNPVLGFELGYMGYGTAEESYIDNFGDTITDTIDSSAVQVGLSARLPLGRVASLVGRIGAASWELDYQNTDSFFPGDVYKDSDSGVDVYFGVGMEFQFEKNFRLGVEYNNLDYTAKIGAANTEHSIDNLAVTVGWTF